MRPNKFNFCTNHKFNVFVRLTGSSVSHSNSTLWLRNRWLQMQPTEVLCLWPGFLQTHPRAVVSQLFRHRPVYIYREPSQRDVRGLFPRASCKQGRHLLNELLGGEREGGGVPTIWSIEDPLPLKLNSGGKNNCNAFWLLHWDVPDNWVIYSVSNSVANLPCGKPPRGGKFGIPLVWNTAQVRYWIGGEVAP